MQPSTHLKLTHLRMWPMALLWSLLGGVHTAQAMPFSYITPHITDSVFKQVAVDDSGTVVVAGYRFFADNQTQKRVVIYRLHADGSLNWLQESDQWNQVFDVVFSADSIWLLHRNEAVTFEQRQVSRIDRFSGEWQWTQPTVDWAHILVYNEGSNRIAVGGNADHQTHIWWHDQSGVLLQGLSRDFVPSQGPFDEGAEDPVDMALMDDHSVIVLLVFPDSNTIRLHRMNFDGSQRYEFDWVTQHQIQQTPQLLLLNQEQAVFYFMDESGFGVPRPVQIAVDANGNFVYNHTNNHPDTFFDGVLRYFAEASPDGTRVNNFIHSMEVNRPLQIFILGAAGDLLHEFEPALPAGWPHVISNQVLFNQQQSVMLVASASLPFPQIGTNTHYAVWSMEGNLCDTQLDMGRDSTAHRIQQDGWVYELVAQDVGNDSAIQLRQRPTWDADCLPIDLIFAAGF